MQRYEVIRCENVRDIEHVTQTSCKVPMDEETRDFIKRFKRFIIENGDTKNPEIVGLLSFFSNSRIEILSKQLEGSMPLGTVFHVCPSNVQSTFVYSCVLSMLCGNTNIVKVSSRFDDVGNFLVHALKSCMGERLSTMNAFVAYDNDHRDITDWISSRSDGRVIWGGDQTITNIRRSQLLPHAVEITFPDRRSSIIASSDFVQSLDEKSLNIIKRALLQDISFSNQAACTSPLSMLWIGKNSLESSRRLWRSTSLQRLSAIDSYEELEKFCLKFEGTSDSSWTFMLKRKEDLINALEEHPKNGLLLQAEFENLDDVVNSLTSKDQTLVVVGFESKEISKFFKNKKSFCRFVKPGQSMLFDQVWDGQDIVERLSRKQR